MNLSILIGTYGDDRWRTLARERALPSAEHQDAEVLAGHFPGGTRAESRNAIAEQAAGDWLCFLDADDQLHPNYVHAMKRAEEPDRLLTPRVQYVVKGKPRTPRFWPEVKVHQGNWMILGTLIQTDLFWQVGGWREFDPQDWNEWDDWDLWIRAQQAGATPKRVPGAIYIAHQEPTSRHRTVPHSQRQKWHTEIQNTYWPDGTPA